VYGDFHREFDDGLFGFGSAANRAIKYFTGGLGYNNTFDTDWGDGQGAVRGEGVTHQYRSGSKGTAYYWLGHAIHLVQDLALPTHSLADQHLELSGVGVNPDPVHDWVDGQAFSDSFFCLTRCADFDDSTADRYRNWYFSAARGGVGRISFLTEDLRSAAEMESSAYNPALQRQEIQDSIPLAGRRLVAMDPLYHLFLEVAGEADNYDARNTAGQFDDGDRGDFSSFDFNNFDFNNYDNWTRVELNEVADDVVPRAMRATAEIFRFFYSQVDQTAAIVRQPDYSTDVLQPTIVPFPGRAIDIPLQFTAADPTSGYDLDGFYVWIDRWDGDAWKLLHMVGQNDGNHTFTGLGLGRYRVRSLVENGAGLVSKSDYGYINVTADPCAFGGDAGCDTDDLAALYAVFNTRVPPTEAQFDLNFDNVIGAADLTEWLSQATHRNGFSQPYLRGDTDWDHVVDTFDLTEMIMNYTGANGGSSTCPPGTPIRLT